MLKSSLKVDVQDWSLKNASVKTGFARDPQAYTNFGYGAIYDSKLGLVGADTLKEFLQELLGD